MKSILFLICFFIGILPMHAQVPSPPEGQRWVLNSPFSDEFNGSSLDLNKWYDYHPYWVGRTPAIFLSSSISLQNGNMQIKNFKLDQDSVYVSPWNGAAYTYTMAGGAVVSKNDNAHYGFYEVKMKASRIRMSSTFWLKNRWLGGHAGAECPNNVTELDIIEAIGGANSNPIFMNNMMSNSHYIHKECGQDDVWHSEGNNSPVGGHVSDDFHVYGAHWKSANQIDFYIDGNKKHTIFPSTAESNLPFARPMSMHMVTETYDWINPPSTSDLNNNARNTTYYDWVRSYYLTDVDQALTSGGGNVILNGGFETGDFTNWVGWGGAPREVVNDNNVHSGNYAVHIVGAGAPEQQITLNPNTTYTLSCFGKAIAGEISLGVKESDAGQTLLNSVEFSEANYTQKSIEFTTGNQVDVKIYFYAEAGEEGYADDFVLTEVGSPIDLVMPFEPSLEFYANPIYQTSTNTFLTKIEYKASVDRDLYIELSNSSGTVISSKTINAFAGYGKKPEPLPVTASLVNGENYTLTVQLLPQGNTDDILAETSYQFTDLVTSTTDLASNGQLKISPNPSHDILRIEGNDFRNFTIFDQIGKMLKKGNIQENNTIQIMDLVPGLYILEIGLERQLFVKI